MYNSLNIPDINNEIGSRGVEISWRELSNNNVWVFGGQTIENYNINTHNNLWKIEACMPSDSLLGINGPDSVCKGDTISLSVSILNGHTFLWEYPSSWTVQENNGSLIISPDVSGNVTIKVIGNCGDTSNIQSKLIYVEEIPKPIITPETQNSVLTLSVPNVYVAYQWKKDGQDINGATSNSIVVDENGAYSIRMSSLFGCTAESQEYLVNDITGINEVDLEKNALIYPNPFNDKLFVNVDAAAKVKLIGLRGDVYFRKSIQKGKNEINMAEIEAGVYFLQVFNDANQVISVYKIIKM